MKDRFSDNVYEYGDQKQIAISKIKGADYNPPGRTKRQQLSKLISSIDKIGLLYPILLDPELNVIDGHRRLAACKVLEWKAIPCRIISNATASEVYADVNSTGKKMNGNDALSVWINNKHAVTDHQSKQFQRMEDDLGHQLTKKIQKEGMSYRVYSTAKRICRHCDRNSDEFLKKVVNWLIDTATIGQVMKAIEHGVTQKALLNAVENNKNLKIAYE